MSIPKADADLAEDSPGRSHGVLWLILALALAIRLVALWVIAPTQLVNDEVAYFMLAKGLSLGGEISDAGGRAPGVIAFYAALFSLFEPLVSVARLGNVVLSTSSVGLIYLLGLRFAGRRAAIGAAGIAAFYPGFIGFSHYLWSETLYIFFELGALALLANHRARYSGLRLAGAGALLGFGALTREVGMVVAMFCAGYLLYEYGSKWKVGIVRAGIVTATCLAIVLPWSTHLYSVTGHPALITGDTWFNFYIANVDERVAGGTTIHPWFAYEGFGSTRSEREVVARSLALKAVWEDMPAWPIRKLAELKNLLAPDSFVVKRLRTPPGSDQPAVVITGDWNYQWNVPSLGSGWFREFWALLTIWAYVVLIFAGVAGLILVRPVHRKNPTALFVFFIVGHVVPPLLTFALTRFRLPLMPIMAIAAAPLFLGVTDVLRESSVRQRVVAVIAIAVTGAAMAAGYLSSLP